MIKFAFTLSSFSMPDRSTHYCNATFDVTFHEEYGYNQLKIGVNGVVCERYRCCVFDQMGYLSGDHLMSVVARSVQDYLEQEVRDCEYEAYILEHGDLQDWD